MNEKEERNERIEDIFNKLTQENKQVINMVAEGMKIAQDNAENVEILKHIPRID